MTGKKDNNSSNVNKLLTDEKNIEENIDNSSFSLFFAEESLNNQLSCKGVVNNLTISDNEETELVNDINNLLKWIAEDKINQLNVSEENKDTIKEAINNFADRILKCCEPAEVIKISIDAEYILLQVINTLPANSIDYKIISKHIDNIKNISKNYADELIKKYPEKAIIQHSNTDKQLISDVDDILNRINSVKFCCELTYTNAEKEEFKYLVNTFSNKILNCYDSDNVIFIGQMYKDLVNNIGDVHHDNNNYWFYQNLAEKIMETTNSYYDRLYIKEKQYSAESKEKCWLNSLVVGYIKSKSLSNSEQNYYKKCFANVSPKYDAKFIKDIDIVKSVFNTTKDKVNDLLQLILDKQFAKLEIKSEDRVSLDLFAYEFCRLLINNSDTDISQQIKTILNELESINKYYIDFAHKNESNYIDSIINIISC